MKLKNKYSKQNIYSNQKFEDQIWYNQQIITFLNFSQLSERVFPQTLSWKPSQILILLESVFHWPTFLLANKHKKVWKVIFRKPLSGKQTQLKENTFLKTKSNFSLTEKCFLLTRKYFSLINFSNDKQTQESLKNGFLKITFQKINMSDVSCAIQARLVHKCSKFCGEHNLRCQCFLCEAGV